jgi:two-component system chemotaxis response regulator CheY
MTRVMIVDDAAFLRAVLREIVEGMGFEVAIEAGDGYAAVKSYKHYRPDVTLMDITMPEMDGITAIKRIMEIDPSAKIIVCSSMGSFKLIMESMQAGAKDFIVKPFDRTRIKESILNASKK